MYAICNSAATLSTRHQNNTSRKLYLKQGITNLLSYMFRNSTSFPPSSDPPRAANPRHKMRFPALHIGFLVVISCLTSHAIPVSFDTESADDGSDLLSQSESDFGTRLRRGAEDAVAVKSTSEKSSSKNTAQDRQVTTISNAANLSAVL